MEPKYVKCTRSFTNFTVGRIYNWPQPVSESGAICTNLNHIGNWTDLFEPATKEAYDRQNCVGKRVQTRDWGLGTIVADSKVLNSGSMYDYLVRLDNPCPKAHFNSFGNPAEPTDGNCRFFWTNELIFVDEYTPAPEPLPDYPVDTKIIDNETDQVWYKNIGGNWSREGNIGVGTHIPTDKIGTGKRYEIYTTPTTETKIVPTVESNIGKKVRIINNYGGRDGQIGTIIKECSSVYPDEPHLWFVVKFVDGSEIRPNAPTDRQPQCEFVVETPVVVETPKPWIITAFEVKVPGVTYTDYLTVLREDGLYYWKVDECAKSKKGFSLAQMLEAPIPKIHSVKRTSDNVEFTVGDRISPGDYTITHFYVRGDNICVEGIRSNGTFSFPLQSLVKAEVLFTSEDGKPVYLRDVVHIVGKNYTTDKWLLSNTFQINLLRPTDKTKIFVSRDAAEAFVEANNPNVIFTTSDGVEIKQGDTYYAIRKDRASDFINHCKATTGSGQHTDYLCFSTSNSAAAYIAAHPKKELKSIVLITDDGVDMSIGDICYSIWKDRKNDAIRVCRCNNFSKKSVDALYFSTIEKAEAYIATHPKKIEKKPIQNIRDIACLSINDVNTIFTSLYPGSNWKQLKQITNLVKQKQQNK